jgi:FkbM family methyltransferase
MGSNPRTLGILYEVEGHLFLIKSFTDLIQQRLSLGQLWEPGLIRLLDTVATNIVTHRGSAHLVNVGAHIGAVCVPVAKRFTNVTAFEPTKESFEHLQLHMRINACNNVECRQLALMDRRGQASIVLSHNNSGGTHVVTDEDIANDTRHASQHTRGATVSCDTLDNLSIAPPDVIVVDVEGSEERFLRGASHTLQTHKPLLIIEIWTDEKRRYESMATTQADIIKMISGLGYTHYKQFDSDTFVFEAHPPPVD